MASFNQQAQSSSSASNVTISCMFNSTKCYDLLPTSRKGIVFETSISFQLAFFSLIEHGKVHTASHCIHSHLLHLYVSITGTNLNFHYHIYYYHYLLLHMRTDTEAACLWDPEKSGMVGMMCISDYIQALLICRKQGISMLELASRSISDMFLSPAMSFKHPDFSGIDAEDSINQLCLLMHRSNADYVPVTDPDEGGLIGMLGYMDIVLFLDQCAKQHAHYFFNTLKSLQIGTYGDSIVAPSSTMLPDVITVIQQKQLLGVPVVDDNKILVGIYHASDVSFIIKAADPDAVIDSLNRLTVGEALLMEKESSSESLTGMTHNLVTCTMDEQVCKILDKMVRSRVYIVVIVDNKGSVLGTLTIKDLLQYYMQLMYA